MQNAKLKIKNCKKGFTLIELLVVIVIIGVLTSFLTANFVGVRQRSRDAQRKSDLRQIQSALEVYRSDTGAYPPTPLPDCGSALTSGSVTYMQKIPCDPSSRTTSYTYSSDRTTYSLIACLENEKDSQKDIANVGPCSGTTNFSYTLKNP